MPEPRGGVNGYACRRCAYVTITINRDEGVTPFSITCTRPGCGGPAYSMFYPPEEVIGSEAVTHEWYRPSLRWARRKGAAMLEHVKRGGLVLRERTGGAP